MICYKDRSWCDTPCGNITCDRNLTEEEFNNAVRWSTNSLKTPHPPIMLAKFRTEDCGYIEEKK
jgi:hypothetical protein